jgi:UDP-glucose 4-epimerase
LARCLVLGGNGFLGSGLVDELVSRGHDVTVFDRFSRLPPTFGEGPRVIAGDFLDAERVSEAVAGQEFVFHFLSATTPASAEDEPGRDVRDNVAPSVSLLQACVRSGVERIYFASTGGAIYGDTPMGAVTENTRPEPVSPYAIGKLAIEGYLAYFRRKHGLKSTSFRISNPYGPRQRAHNSHGAIPTFLAHASKGTTITVYGDGTSVRDFVYAEDAVRMMVDVVGGTPTHSIYNIGSGEGTSIVSLLEVIAEVTGHSSPVEYLPEPSTFVHRSVLDTSRYAAEYSAHGLVSLRDGIDRTWRGMAGRS